METSIACAERVLEDDFKSVRESISISFDLSAGAEIARENTIKDSPTYGIRTRYMRTSFKGQWVGTWPTVLPVPARASTASTHMHGCSSSSSGSRGLDLTVARRSTRSTAEKVAAVFASIEGAMAIWNSASARWEVFVWLSQAQFDVVSASNAEAYMKAWVASIDVSSLDEFSGGESQQVAGSDPCESENDNESSSSNNESDDGEVIALSNFMCGESNVAGGDPLACNPLDCTTIFEGNLGRADVRSGMTSVLATSLSKSTRCSFILNSALIALVGAGVATFAAASPTFTPFNSLKSTRG